MKNEIIHVTIITTYNKEVEKAEEFINELYLSTADEVEQGILNIDMILVNEGDGLEIQHPFITKFIKLDTDERLTRGLREVQPYSQHVLLLGDCSFPVDNGWLTKLVK